MIKPVWRNHKGHDCKAIPLDAKCLCDHLYKQHSHLNAPQTHCKEKKCTCPAFFYVPLTDYFNPNCYCDHSNRYHDPITHHCTKGNCGGCHKGYNIAFVCPCGDRFDQHKTFFEGIGVKEEKQVPLLEKPLVEIKEKAFVREEALDEEQERLFRKKNRLVELNNRIEKPLKVIENEAFSDEEGDFVKALTLYNTPHGYIRYKIKFF